MQTFATAVKKSLDNMKIQFKYHRDEAKRVAETMMDDPKIAMSIISLSHQEEQRLLEIIDQAGKRLNILVTNGALIEKSIRGLLILAMAQECQTNTKRCMVLVLAFSVVFVKT